MFLNSLNNLNYHITYRSLLKGTFKSKLNRTSNLLFTNKSKNIASQHVSSAKEVEPQVDLIYDEVRRYADKIDDLTQTANKYCNLTSYMDMVREAKCNVKSTYLFIIQRNKNDKKTVQLPDKLNSKNFDYFNLNNREMCLVDFDCSNEIVDSIFQSSQEKELVSHDRFYHVKGPFLNANKLVTNDNQTAEEIKFQNYKRVELDLIALKQMNSVDEQFDYLCKETEVDHLEKRIKYLIINYLERFICTGLFNNFELIPYGSSFTGLGFKHSDLDLILLPKPLNKNTNADELDFIERHRLSYLYKQRILDKRLVNQCLSLVGNLLTMMPGIERDIHLSAASVPIVKAKCPALDAEMDISMGLTPENNGVVLMSQVLYAYHNLFPILRRLYVVLRLWATQHELIKTPPSPYLKNFNLLMLIIAFLQIRKPALLPNMKSILENDEESIKQCYINNKVAENSLSELILEFIEFLGKTPFERDSLDLWEGKVSRNFSQKLMYVGNPFDVQIPNMARSIGKRCIIALKQTAKSTQQSYNPNDLSSLFHTKKEISVPSFQS